MNSCVVSWLFLLNLYPTWCEMRVAFPLEHEIWWVWHFYLLFDMILMVCGADRYSNMICASYIKKKKNLILSSYLTGREKLCTAHANLSHKSLKKKKKKLASADVFAFEFSGKYHAPMTKMSITFLFQNSECDTKIVKWLLCWGRLVGYVGFTD